MRRKPTHMVSFATVSFAVLILASMLGFSLAAEMSTNSKAEKRSIHVSNGPNDPAPVEVILKVSGGRITEITGVKNRRTFKFEQVKAGASSALACAGENKKSASLDLGRTRKLTFYVCAQPVAELSLKPGGGLTHNAFFDVFEGDNAKGAKLAPRCWEDEELQMSICE